MAGVSTGHLVGVRRVPEFIWNHPHLVLTLGVHFYGILLIIIYYLCKQVEKKCFSSLYMDKPTINIIVINKTTVIHLPHHFNSINNNKTCLALKFSKSL